MTRIKAAEKAGLSVSAIHNYIAKGYMEPIVIDGYEFVYYRDVLRASWIASQKDLSNRFKGK